MNRFITAMAILAGIGKKIKREYFYDNSFVIVLLTYLEIENSTNSFLFQKDVVYKYAGKEDY